jgi:hypothetical protein
MERALTAAGYGAAALGLLVLSLLAWTGHLVQETRSEPDPKPAARTTETPPASPPPPNPSPPTKREGTPAAARTPTSSVVLSAARGDCWLSVRAGGESGEVLYEGVLPQGESLQFKRRKLWLRLGAASNLEISVDGKPAEVPAGTVDIVLPLT